MRIRRGLPTAVMVALLLTIVIALTVSSVTLGGFSASAVSNNNFSSGTLLLSDTIGGSACKSSATQISTNQTICSTYPLSNSPGSQTTTLSNYGTVNPSSASLALTGTCGVQDFADVSSAGSNTAIPIGGVTYGATGPTKYAGSSAAAFNGTNGAAETLNEVASPAPQTYSIAAWFKTSSATGSIVGYTNVQYPTTPSDYDRMVWIDPDGYVVFGTYPGSLYELSSSATTTHNYADGSWHFLVITISVVNTNFGTVDMYIDGSLVAGSADDESLTSQPGDTGYPYAGWWHLGYSYTVTWNDQPTGEYWNGSLADIAVLPTALSASQVTTLYSQTSQSAVQTAMLADSPTSYWPLQDTGSTLYTGSIANLSANASGQYGDYSANPGTNYGTGEGTLGTDSSGPIGTTATTFNGSSGYIETAVGGSGSFLASPGPQTYSIAAWFKTSSATGSIIGFASAQGNSGTNHDRMIWLDPSGHVLFGLKGSSQEEISSSATTTHDYADGTWHFVVVTVVPTTTTRATVLMYIGGSLVAGSANDETITASETSGVYGGYWHLGWSGATAYSDPPTSVYWKGSFGQVAVFPTALTAANVTALSGESSYSAFSTAVTGGVAASNAYWPLNDSALPTSAACSYIAVTAQVGSVCVYPALDTACPSNPPVTSWLSGFTTSLSVPVLPSLTFNTSVTLGATTVPSTGTGLHISAPLSISETKSGWTATLLHQTGYVLL